MKNIVSYIEVDDPTNQKAHSVEVTVTLNSGEKRWCFFMTPEILSNCGDYVQDTKVRMHIGVKHMIIVSELSKEVINTVVRQLDNEGVIAEHTLPLV